MATDRSKLSHQSQDHPIDGDTLMQNADVADFDLPPAELNSPQNYLVIDRMEGADRSGSHRKQTDNTFDFVSLENHPGVVAAERANYIFGHRGGDLKAVEVHHIDDAQKDTEPHMPKWSGIAYAPRAAHALKRVSLRRRSGARVHPEAVFPPDERQIYYPSAYPWRIIGRIFVWTNASAPNWAWSGSASLVGRSTILTASHVVPWDSGGNWKALFVPAYYDGASLYGANAASWILSAQGYRNHDQGDDMAVMRLAQPLGEWLGYFGYKTYNDDWEDGNYWTVAGYPGDLSGGARPSAHYWFPITDDDNDGAGVELEYRADTNSGNSGGPVFGWWSGKPYVVGTHSGWEDNFGEPKQNVAAGGSALSSLIGWARANWP